ncbi:MAG: GNAT family protein [Candidatus Omnitrophota bacterium]|nr:GNAT family protein [Candidatus Omnitrophota bacterium]
MSILSETQNKLRGKKFNLRPLVVADVSDAYIGWLNDPVVNQFLEARFSKQSTETARAYVAGYYEGGEKYIWGIYPQGSKDFIGTATLSEIRPEHGWGEIGLLIGDKLFWGKNASTEALDLVVKFGFQVLKLRRLTGGSYAPNLGMNFTFKRCGFRCEAKLVRAYRLGENQYVDGYRWGLLAEEWRERK